ncbi:MAG: GTP 3',8-cyclase MoaA [Sulfuricaulis sp.]|uniref:GTP 3',8-cyclase MoaA n=1 Tax=Sulfuricaulis sp. TaxID=2003553 RepID=UPI0025E2C127|nr:GTP 3',8-cyclase MoaA [Sulfuricaulis sp.]MCR4346645.1 GTP 3',8-cyclase MoaA [Sulfuricaulis sp.]
MLIDSFGRCIDYLRVSVTDRCNYRCFYCMPRTGVRFAAAADLLTSEELARLIRLFAELGVHRVRLTGGEPLVRRDLAGLAAMIGRLPDIVDLSLSTNGQLLARHAHALKQAGVTRVNISLDSLDPKVFARIACGGDLRAVLRGIEAALDAGMAPVKLNMVVMRGINDQEIETMLEFAVAHGVDLRYIETMPVGPQAADGMAHHYPAALILERLRRHAGAELVPAKGGRGAGPARYYQIGSGPVRVGVISAVSRHFCAGCNRVRLTASGELVLCLGHNDRVSLREALRGGCSDETLKTMIRAAVMNKPERHDFQKTGGEIVAIPMSALGG